MHPNDINKLENNVDPDCSFRISVYTVYPICLSKNLG